MHNFLECHFYQILLRGKKIINLKKIQTDTHYDRQKQKEIWIDRQTSLKMRSPHLICHSEMIGELCFMYTVSCLPV